MPQIHDFNYKDSSIFLKKITYLESKPKILEPKPKILEAKPSQRKIDYLLNMKLS